MSAVISLGATPVAAATQRPNCENFLDQPDAQIAFDVDPSDPFNLDADADSNVCEDPQGTFGTTPLANCDDLRDHPDIARALFDASLSKYGLDRYDLGGCVEQGNTNSAPPASDRSNGGGGGKAQDPLDGPPPDTASSDSPATNAAAPDTSGNETAVSPREVGTGGPLEARLEARFAAFEAEFALFEVRAANGFGAFPASRDNAASGGQASSKDVSMSRESAPVTQHAVNTAVDESALAQLAGGAKDAGPRLGARHTVQEDGKGGSAREHRGKRGHHKAKHRGRR